MIGAHNTLTAYPPRSWWMRPFAFLYKCQRKYVGELLKEGVEFFDIRLRFGEDRIWACHGLADIDVYVFAMIVLIARGASNPTIRLILEKGDDVDKELFINQCRNLEYEFPNVKFIGGNYKPTWERLYAFKNDDVQDNIVQYVGSMQSWWGKICPWLYARLRNRKNLAKAIAEPDKYYLFDFL